MDSQKRRARREAEDVENALRAVAATPAGRRVMWHILEHCGYGRSIWVPSAQIHYNSGQQDVAFWLIAQLEQAEPGTHLAMTTEAAGREKLYRAERPRPVPEDDDEDEAIA